MMIGRVRPWLLVLAVSTASLGCGKGETASSSTAASGASATTVSSPATVKPAASISFVDVASGKVLGDSTGLPLYALETDAAGTGACTDACAQKWPPVAPATATAAPGIDSSKVGEITRADGSKQLTYFGKPLYTFVGDNPGVATCQGGDGKWWLLNADGTLNKKPA